MSAPDSASIAPDTLSISPGSGEPSASEKAGDYMVGETKTGDYVVVARRYRPTAFDQLVGQQHVARALSRAIETHRVGHAYLFTGARGVGKTSTARILAKALNCAQGPTATPCNACEICQGVTSGDDVDVIEIDGASNRGIDEIRQLRQNANVRPSRARFKIYIIDEVHMLTKEAFNALLKTLEEPPEHVKFIFATTEANKIPITILSRCQRFDFAGIDMADISRRLREIATTEGIGIDDEALQILSRRAAGSMRDSQSLLEQLLALGLEEITAAEVHSLLGTAPETRLLDIAAALAAHDARTALEMLDAAVRDGVEVAQLVEQMLGVFRDIMAGLVGCDAARMLNISTTSGFEGIRQLGQQFGLESVLAAMQILEQASSRMRGSLHGRALAEMALVRVASLERLDDLADLIEVVQSGEPIAVPVGAAAGRIAAGDDLALKKNKLAKPEAAVSAARGPAGTSSASTARAAQSFSSGGSNPGFTGGSRFGGDPNSAFLQSAAEDGEEEDDAGVYQGASSAARSSLRREPSQTPVSPSPAPSLRSSDSNSSTAAELGAALTAENAAGVWEAALAKLEGIAADQGSLCRSVANIGPNHLVVSFGKKYTFCKDLCERPDQKSRIEAALAEVTGQRVRLDFAIVDDMPDQTSGANKPKSVSLRQFQSEVAARPLVRRALELFDAENPRIDAPESS